MRYHGNSTSGDFGNGASLQRRRLAFLPKRTSLRSKGIGPYRSRSSGVGASLSLRCAVVSVTMPF